MSVSQVIATPPVGDVRSTVAVEWKFGYDVTWTPTTNDEVRLVTTSGVLVARVSMRTATAPVSARLGRQGAAGSPLSSSTHSSPSHANLVSAIGIDRKEGGAAAAALTLREARVVLPTAPFGGSFVLVFVDCGANFRRVLTVPFRITGSEHAPPRVLNILSRPVPSVRWSEKPTNTTAVSRSRGAITAAEEAATGAAPDAEIDDDNFGPQRRLTFTVPRSLIAHQVLQERRDRPVDSASASLLRFVVVKEGLGDNLGGSDVGVGPYDHCASVARVPITAFSASLCGFLSSSSSEEVPSASSLSGGVGGDERDSMAAVELVTPSEPGTYQVRLMATWMNGVPHSVACSRPFHVVLPRPEDSSTPSSDAIGSSANPRGQLYGELFLSHTSCVAGEEVRIEYQLHSPDLHLLSRLDSVWFAPLGRPEAISHEETMCHSVLEVVGSKQICVRAPAEPGVYEAVYYSFLEQQPVMISKTPLHVDAPHFEIRLLTEGDDVPSYQTCSTLNGKTVYTTKDFVASFYVSVAASMYHTNDRLALVDESSNVVCQVAVSSDPTEGDGRDLLVDASHLYAYNDVVGGGRGVVAASAAVPRKHKICPSVRLYHPVAGKYTVHYFSQRARRFVYQAPAYLEFTLESGSGIGGSGSGIRSRGGISSSDNVGGLDTPFFPTAALRSLAVLPRDEPMEVEFSKEGVDSRPASLQLHDVVALYVHEMPDLVATPAVDDVAALPCYAVRHLRGVHRDRFVFPSAAQLAEQIERSLASSTAGRRDGDERDAGSQTTASSAGVNNLGQLTVPPTSPLRRRQEAARHGAATGRGAHAQQQPQPSRAFFTPDTLALLRGATHVVLRYMVSLDGGLRRICASEAVVRTVDRASIPSFRPIPVRQVAVRELAPVAHRLTSAMTSDGTVSGAVTPIALQRRQVIHRGAPRTIGKQQWQPRVFRVMEPGSTEFAGAVLPPKGGCSTAETLTVTYHVTGGLPRPFADRVVLFSPGAHGCVAQCSLEWAVAARPDRTMGTVFLQPPQLEGTYVAGYYSDLYEAIVIVSDPFRIHAAAVDTTTTTSSSNNNNVNSSAADGGRIPLHQMTLSHRHPSHLPPSLGAQQQRLSATPNISELARGAAGTMTLHSPTVGARRQTEVNVIGHRIARLPRCKVLIACVSYQQQPHELKGPSNDSGRLEAVARSFFIQHDENSHYAQGATTAATNTSNNKHQTVDHLLQILHEGHTDKSRHPTADNIVQGLQWLLADAIAGDHLVFCFSGAGSVTPSGSPCLLPVDFDWSDMRCLTHPFLMDSFVQRAPEGCCVTLLLDCCYYSTPLETFRRGELRSMSAGEESSHHGWTGLQRRRRYAGVGFAPWRCVPPPNGAHIPCGIEDACADDNTSAFRCALRSVTDCWDASVPVAGGIRHNSGTGAPSPCRCHAVIYEACRGSAQFSDGAWDVFIRESGATHGLFTHYLCSVLLDELVSSSSTTTTTSSSEPRPPITWLELHELVQRKCESMAYRQQPRLWVSSPEMLRTPVRFLSSNGVGEES